MCSAAASGNLNVLEVRNPVEAKPGEKVIIEVQPAALVKAATLVYLLPATVMLGGATVGWLRTGTDLGAIIGAVSGLVISALILFFHVDRKERGNGPTISHIMAR
jgi:sigma-E factor negative regulatory protein RseC